MSLGLPLHLWNKKELTYLKVLDISKAGELTKLIVKYTEIYRVLCNFIAKHKHVEAKACIRSAPAGRILRSFYTSNFNFSFQF